MTEHEQFQCLNILDYLSDLFTVAGKESFTKAEILVVINHVKNDRDFFSAEVVIAQEIAVNELPESTAEESDAK